MRLTIGTEKKPKDDKYRANERRSQARLDYPECSRYYQKRQNPENYYLTVGINRTHLNSYIFFPIEDTNCSDSHFNSVYMSIIILIHGVERRIFANQCPQ